MMEKLWGDNFFDPGTKKWTKRHTGSETCKRGFVQFVYEPIKTIIDAAMTDNKQKVFTMCEKLGIAGKIRSEDKEKTGKPLMKSIMQAWLPAHEVRGRPIHHYALICRPHEREGLSNSSCCVASVCWGLTEVFAVCMPAL